MTRFAAWLRLGLLAVCVLGLALTLRALGPGRVLAVVRQADPWWLALSVVPLLARFGLWAVKWQRIVRRAARLPFVTCTRILFAGSLVNLVTPTAKLGGGFVRALLLDRHAGVGLPAALGRALADQVTNSLGAMALFGVLAVAAQGLAPPDTGDPWLFGAGAAVLMLLGTGLAVRPAVWRRVRDPRWSQWIGERLPQRLRAAGCGDTRRVVLDVCAPLLGETPARRTIVPDIAGGGLAFGAVCAANAMMFKALGVETDVLTVAAAVVVGYFVGSLTGVVGGVGATEIALTGLYVRAGVPPSAAAAGALVHRASLYLVVLVLGGASLWTEAAIRRTAPAPRCR